MSAVAAPAEDDDGNRAMIAQLLETVEELTTRVLALEGGVRRTQSNFGQSVFLANTAAGDGTFYQVRPEGPGSTNTTAVDMGRAAEGTDPADCPLLRLRDVKAVYQVRTGTSTAYFPLTTQVVKFGKVNQVGDCGSYVVVYETDSGGNVIEPQRDVTVQTSWSGCTAAGICVEIDQVIAFVEADPPDTLAFMLTPYKQTRVTYTCSDTNSASVEDLTRMALYNSDFLIVPGADCVSGTNSVGTNLASVYWMGNYCKSAVSSSVTTQDHVKVFDFDSGNAPSSASTSTNNARIWFSVNYATTRANVPTVGGAPCEDESGPYIAKIAGFFPTGVTIDAGQAITLSVDTNACTVSMEFATMRALVPWP